MKWRNGKFERIYKTTVFACYDNDACYVVEICERDADTGCFRLVDGCLFYNRSEAVAWAGKHRLARLYPGRLLGGDFIYE